MPKEIFEYHQYTGLRKTFLDRQCAVYMQLREKTIKKELPMPKLEAYVVVIVTMYFETFPWWMAEDEEPGENFKGLEPKGEEAVTRKEETIKQHSGWIQAHMEFAWRYLRLMHTIRIFEDTFGITLCTVDHACKCNGVTHKKPRPPLTYLPEAFHFDEIFRRGLSAGQ